MKFLPTSDGEREAMLAAIGASSVEDLFASVPPAVRQAPDLPAPLSEIEIRRFLGGLAALSLGWRLRRLAGGSGRMAGRPAGIPRGGIPRGGTTGRRAVR